MINKNINEIVLEKARKVKLLLMDCDGVLTDGKLYFTENGEELKVFHVRDGQGIVMWHQAGFKSGVISGRRSKIVHLRAKELGMHFIKDGSNNKVEDFENILENTNFNANEVAYIGDDTPDICLMKKVGFPVAVADAVLEMLPLATYVTKSNGGNMAVREVVELLLHAKNTFG